MRMSPQLIPIATSAARRVSGAVLSTAHVANAVATLYLPEVRKKKLVLTAFVLCA